MNEDEDDINEIDEEEFKFTTLPESLEHGELGLFLKAVPVLLKHLDGLLSHPAKSAACVPFVEFSLSFKYGQVRKSLPFGCILREWEKGRLVETCPHCGGPLYVYRSFAQFLEGIEARLTFRGMSMLAHAEKGENLPAAQLLIEYGADKDEEGFPELEAVLREVLACGESDFTQHLMLEALLGVALRRLEERFRGE